jgi:hypothetical protein
MENEKKKRLKEQYRTAKRPLGVFLIRNLENDKVFVVAGLNLAGIMNRHRFALSAGNHANKELQNDWTRLGADSFAFEILDQIELRADPSFDARRELAFLEEMWLEKLEPYDEHGYNERPISRDQRLRRIASRTREGS